MAAAPALAASRSNAIRSTVAGTIESCGTCVCALACAISARRRGIDPLIIDAGAVVSSIVRYPIGMTFFTTPERLEIGNRPIVCAGAKATREEAMMYYRGIARAEALRIGVEEPAGDDLAHDAAPLRFVHVGANAEGRQLVVAELRHLRGRPATQHVDQVRRAKASSRAEHDG